MAIAHQKQSDEACLSAQEEDVLRESLSGLCAAAALDEDLRRELEATARSGIQRIVDVMAQEYKAVYDTPVVPQGLWKVLWTRAYFNYVRHCACLMKDLKTAAFDPNIRF